MVSERSTLFEAGKIVWSHISSIANWLIALNRDDIGTLKDYLHSLGADHVYTYEDLKDKQTVQHIKSDISKKVQFARLRW